ncbi:MAG TPA: MBL fold metallo-hydrolase [Nitrososphaerales archaeon]|nr:MBL fold metallo-hydrolase [Nitrososphaerales archaeon]
MEITFLGGAREVGKSAILVKGDQNKILLDYGAQTGREPTFPMHVQPKDVHTVLLTHAHLDHSGGVPLFFLGEGVKLVTTGLSLELTTLLLEDFIKLSGFYLPFEYIDLLAMAKNTQRISIRDEISVAGEFKARFPSAGHIPGATTIILEHNGKRVLYTGDINLRDSQLLKGADLDFGRLDAVITESTYSQVEHDPRQKIEDDFVLFANDVVERGGVLLVPAFSVGRAQEIACLLRARGFKHPVAMDGMALKTNDILFRHQESLRDPELFRKTMENIDVVSGWSHRRRLVKTPGVIISPAGMLAGGASVFYNEHLATGQRNGISIVAFQVPGSPGRTLLDRGLTVINGKTTPVKAEVRRFDFSGHAGRSELFEIFKHVEGDPRVYAIHGDGPSCEVFSREIQERYGFKSSAPSIGDKIIV